VNRLFWHAGRRVVGVVGRATVVSVVVKLWSDFETAVCGEAGRFRVSLRSQAGRSPAPVVAATRLQLGHHICRLAFRELWCFS